MADRRTRRAAGASGGSGASGGYPPINDYALLSDCHSSALVSRDGSIDWCSMPRTDSPSCFGRLLDWERGGHFSISPRNGARITSRSYVEGSLVLRTVVSSGGGEAHIIDAFAMRKGGRSEPHRQLLRIVEGIRGKVDFEVRIAPRFDYGEVKPWLHRTGPSAVAAIGGNNGLMVASDFPLETDGHDITGGCTVRAEERARISIQWCPPELLDGDGPAVAMPDELDRRLRETLEWWARWASRARIEGPDAPGILRSALTLRALVNAPTGAIAAAPTTSLPERIGGERNWDYRFSWIRDSSFSVRSLADIGFDREADGFRRFIQRSAAGSAHDLQIMYGLGGERRLTELELPALEGYRGSRPVRIGNRAAEQLQLDAYGELVLLSLRWHRRGQSPDDDYWRFLVDLVDTACERWPEPDHGIWEIRGEPQHFVHSKVMCWAALDGGLSLAEECLRQAPVRRWRNVARAMRESILENGYDRRRGTFIQAYGKPVMDSSLLLLPASGFIEWGDERMLRTVDAVRADLEEEGLLLRYRPEHTDDGLRGSEGSFLACTFWLAEGLARQGRADAAREVFDRVAGTCNDVGLFAEEFDTGRGEALGNFPQGLTHFSHIAAGVALAEFHRAATRG